MIAICLRSPFLENLMVILGRIFIINEYRYFGKYVNWVTIVPENGVKISLKRMNITSAISAVDLKHKL